MSGKIKYFLIVLGVFIAGFSFSLFTSGHVSADPVDPNRQPLLVEILNLPLAITGAVSVDNLPVDETSNSLRTTSPAEVLRDGGGTISFDSGYDRHIDIPGGVVLTDFIIRRWSSSDRDECWIYLHRPEIGTLMNLYPSEANPVVELHFESGVRSTLDREIGFWMNADCIADVFWTGYEY